MDAFCQIIFFIVLVSLRQQKLSVFYRILMDKRINPKLKVSLLVSLYVRRMKNILMTRLSVCSLGVSCNEMIDTPMLLVVHSYIILRQALL